MDRERTIVIMIDGKHIHGHLWHKHSVEPETSFLRHLLWTYNLYQMNKGYG